MKNFTFRVIPNQADLENNKWPRDEEPCPLKKECPKQETSTMPCPPCPCPLQEPSCPEMPCSYSESGMMTPNYQQYSVSSVPPFTCPNFRLAHAYVPWQHINTVFCPAEALCNGTLFPELNMPQGQYGPCEGPRPCKIYFGGGAPYGCK